MFKNFLIIFGCLLPTISFAQTNDINTHGYFNFHGGSLPINAKTIIDVDGVDYVIGDLIKQINEGFGNISTLEAAIQQAGLDAQTALNLANQAQTTANNAIPLSQKGSQNGVASLDENKNITNSIIGNVSNGIADSTGDLVSYIADIAKSTQTTANGAVQMNGGDASKTIVIPTGKTQSQTLDDISSLAINSVPQSSVGAAKGVAPLDSNTMMSADVSGGVSQATAKTKYTNAVPRTVQSILSDTKNVADYGAKLDDSQMSTDMNIINTLWQTKPQVVDLPTGIIWPHPNGVSTVPNTPGGNIVVQAHGEVNWWPSYPVTDYGIGFPIPDFGDGVTSILYGANAAIAVSRVDNDDIAFNLDWPNIAFNYMADTTKEHGNAGAPGMLNINIHSVAGKNKRGMMAGVNDTFDSLSMGYYGDDDVQNWHHMGIWGTDWTWSNIREVNQFIPFYFSTGPDGYFNQATYVNEEDFSSAGPENAASAYDPTAANRKMFWLNSGYGTMGGGSIDSNGNKVPSIASSVQWKASTPYHRYQEIVVADSTGQPWIFYGLNKDYNKENGSGGTDDTLSGTTAPAWNFTKDATTTDGDIIWTCTGTFTVDFGTIIGVSGENDPKTGWIARIGTLMEEDTNYIYNAIFDMSKAAFDPNVTHIFARMQKDMYLDLTADGTAAGQNNHLLGYSNDGTGFGYKLSSSANGTSSSSTPFSVTDDGVTHVTSFDLAGDKLTTGRQLVHSYNTDGSISGSFLALRWGFPYVHLFVDEVDLGRIQTDSNVFSMSKADILAISNPTEGRTIYNTDDHEEDQYRCPTSTTCGWFPLQYGTALSN